MANTYTCLNIHIVFSTKNREMTINQELSHRLWPYMGGIANENKVIPLAIGGAVDHAHLLISFSATSALLSWPS